MKTKHTRDKHIKRICKEAGLGVMEQVIEIIVSREEIKDRDILKLTSEDVAEFYNSWIGPAIDQIEAEIQEHRWA